MVYLALTIDDECMLKFMTLKTVTIDVKVDTSVQQMKCLLADQENYLDPDEVDFFINNVRIIDQRNLRQLNISEDQEIIVKLKKNRMALCCGY